MNKVLSCAAVLGLTIGATAAQAAPVPVDLTTWERDGTDSSWNVQPGNDAVLQTVNGSPTAYFEAGSNAQGTALSGNIKVQTTSDNDFIGFLLGYQDNEINSSTANYVLVDWKKADQTFSGRSGSAGLALSLVSDGDTELDFWDHSGGITEIERAATLGATGWVSNVDYAFDITFTSSLIEVLVDGVLELSVTAAEAGVAAFDDGAFAFYNYSQQNVLYSAIAERELPPTDPTDPTDPADVPVPASMLLLIPGLAGIAAARRKSARNKA